MTIQVDCQQRSAGADAELHAHIGFVRALVVSVALFMALFVFGSTVWYIVKFNNPLPLWDEWENLDRFLNWISQNYPFDQIFYQHNDHRIYFPNLIFFADYFWFGGREIVTEIAMVLTQIIQAGLLLWCLRGAAIASWMRVTVSAVVVVLLFSMRQFDNFFWHFELQFLMVFAAATLSFVAYGSTLAHARGGRFYLAALLLAFAAALVSTFSMANGVLSGFVLVAMGLLMRAPYGLLATTIAWATALSLLFLHGYETSQTSHTISGAALVLAFGRFLTAYLGNIIGFNLRLAQALGGWGLALTGLAAIRVTKVKYTEHVCAILFAIMLFVVGSAALTALGRMYDGSANALTRRYVTPSAIFWSAHLVFWTIILARKRSVRLATTLVAGTTMVMLCAGALTAQVLAPAELNARDADLRQSTDALLTGIFDPRPMGAVYNDKDVVLPILAFMRQRRISIFADPRNDLLGQDLASHSTPDNNACTGSIKTITPMPDGNEGVFEVSGQAWDIIRDAPVDRLFIVDETGTVVGYASDLRRDDKKNLWRGYAVPPRRDSRLMGLAMLDDRRVCLLSGVVRTSP